MRDTITVGNVELNGGRFCVVVAGEDIPVTLQQFKILRCLMMNRGVILTPEQISDAYREIEGLAATRNVAVHVSRINHKIGFRFIESVYGIGYMVREEATL